MKITDAKATAQAALDFTSPTYDAIIFHNLAQVGAAIHALTSSKVAENRVLGKELETACTFYHIGRGGPGLRNQH